jgi:hypothetical protein
VIIEFCGLPGSGKSSFINLLENSLKDVGIQCELVAPPPLYGQLGLVKKKDFARGILQVALNVLRYPRVTVEIFLQFLRRGDEPFNLSLFRLFICLQYHLNWFRLRAKIFRCQEPQKTYLLDGSPLNIISDYPRIRLFGLRRVFSRVYGPAELESKDLIVISSAAPALSFEKMVNRQERWLEIQLYGDYEYYRSLSISFQDLPETLSSLEINLPNMQKVDLFAIDPHSVARTVAELRDRKVGQ